MILTLATIKQSTIPQVLNLCPDDPKLIQYVNEAQERLMSTPKDWLGTWQSAMFLIRDQCIIWPQGVLEIRAAKMGGRPMVLRNSWYEYVQPVGEPYEDRVTGNFLVLQDQDWTPVITNIIQTGNTVRLFAGDASDYGKRVLVQGYDQNMAFVRTADGANWVNGEYVTLQRPWVDTNTKWGVNGITGIQKDVTNQVVLMREISVVTGKGTDMAVFEPDITVPRFKRSRIINYNRVKTIAGCGCSEEVVMECVVKRAHVPVRVDSDYLVLQNLAAFKDACMAVKREQDEGPGAGSEYMASAKRLLQGELENVLGRKFHITADYHGGHTFSRGVMAGMR